jgi:hypothetical protein
MLIIPDEIVSNYFSTSSHINKSFAAFLIINLIYFVAQLFAAILILISKKHYKFYSENSRIFPITSKVHYKRLNPIFRKIIRSKKKKITK